jgi:P4 family phage/plasmid primase-like protien
MSQKQMTKEQVELFRWLFRGRNDVYGSDGNRCVKEPLTDEVIQEHLTGKRRVGVYPLSPEILDGKGTWWSAIDFDDNDINSAIQLRDILMGLGIDCYIEKSKSKGYHTWVFFVEPTLSIKARAIMKHALTILERETGSSVKEIFPKQDAIIDKDSYGNYLNLPLFAEDVANGRTVFLNPDDSFKPYQDQGSFLQSIKKVTPQQIDDLIAQTEIKLTEEPPVKDKDDQSSFSWQIMHPCFQEMIKGVGEGNRNNVAFVLARHLRIKDFPQNATMAILQNVWNQNNKPPMESSEISKIVEDVYQWNKGKGYAGLGCESIKQFCGQDKCIVYRKYWEQQGTPSSKYFSNGVFIPKLLADELLDEYFFINAGDQLYVYLEGVYKPIGEVFIRQMTRGLLEKQARINHVKEVTEHIRDCTFTEIEKLNTHTDLINLPEGMLNWRTMELLPHSESYLSSIRIPVEFDPQAECPLIDKFFGEVLPPDCIPLVLEIIGYCLIIDKRSRYSLVFLFHGGGSNGKSVLNNLILHLIGQENSCHIPLQQLDENRFKRADLVGKLLCSFSDLSSKPIESSSYLKTITGGDKIDIERKNKDPQYVNIYTKLLYSCNEIPKSGGDQSYGLYRRLCIISFPNRFTGKDADKSLIDKLTQPKELSGLLNKALVALRRLYEQDGFTEAESSKKMLEHYKKRNDPTSAFVTDCCSLDDLNARTERSILYQSYSVYCKNSGYWREGRNDFYERIRNYPGIREVEGSETGFFFEGIQLINKSSLSHYF